MGRKRIPPTLIEDEPRKKPKKKEPIDAKKVIGHKSKVKAEPAKEAAKRRVETPPMTAKEAVKKLAEPNPIIEDIGWKPPKTREEVMKYITPSLPKLPDLPAKPIGTVMKHMGGTLTVVYTKRVFVVHDEREGTVTIREVE